MFIYVYASNECILYMFQATYQRRANTLYVSGYAPTACEHASLIQVCGCTFAVGMRTFVVLDAAWWQFNCWCGNIAMIQRAMVALLSLACEHLWLNTGYGGAPVIRAGTIATEQSPWWCDSYQDGNKQPIGRCMVA